MVPIATAPERAARRTTRHGLAAAVFAAAASQAGIAAAQPAGWTVVPEITLRETYTDNAFVGTAPRRHDFVTQVNPGLRIEGRTPRLTTHFNYQPSALLYSRFSEGNNVVNNLDASARLEAVERIFFVEALGSITQNFISPFAAQPADITSVTPNRIETRSVSLSPYFRGALGRVLEYELRNRTTATTSSDSTLGDFRTTQWTGRLTRPVGLLGWALEYDDTDFRRDLSASPDQQSRLFRGRLYYQPDPIWRLSASAGREENNFVLQQVHRESIRGVGLAWRPGPRTTADLEYEHRFFGPSRLARLSHRTPLTAWQVVYLRNTTTFQEQVLSLPPGNTAALVDQIFAGRIADPAQRATAVQQFLQTNGTPPFLTSSLAFYTQRVFLQESVNASFAILGARNSMAFTAFRTENTRISADPNAAVADAFVLSQRFKQRGFGVHAAHRLTPSTSLGANATRTLTRQEQPAQLESRNDHYTLTLNHALSPRTTTFAGASLSRFEPESSDQDARSVYVGLNHRF